MRDSVISSGRFEFTFSERAQILLFTSENVAVKQKGKLRLSDLSCVKFSSLGKLR